MRLHRLLLSALLFFSGAVFAQSYPAKPVRMVVAFPAGGIADLYARIAESLPGFDVANWIALFVPAGTPPEIVRRWNAEVNRIMQSPDIQARLPNEGARFMPNTPEQFAAFVKAEIAKWAPVVKASGARVE